MAERPGACVVGGEQGHFENRAVAQQHPRRRARTCSTRWAWLWCGHHGPTARAQAWRGPARGRRPGRRPAHGSAPAGRESWPRLALHWKQSTPSPPRSLARRCLCTRAAPVLGRSAPPRPSARRPAPPAASSPPRNRGRRQQRAASPARRGGPAPGGCGRQNLPAYRSRARSPACRSRACLPACRSRRWRLCHSQAESGSSKAWSNGAVAAYDRNSFIRRLRPLSSLLTTWQTGRA